jgi:hypothetical protein
VGKATASTHSGRNEPDRATAIRDLGATSTAQHKNPLDKQDVPRNGKWAITVAASALT